MFLLIISIFFFIISIFTMKYKRKSKSYIFHSILIGIYLFFLLIFGVSFYFTGEGVNESVLITLQLGLGNAGFKEYIGIISLSVLFTVIIFAFIYLYIRVVKNSNNFSKLRMILHNISLLIAFVSMPLFYQVFSLYKHYHYKQSNDFYKFYSHKVFDINKTNYNLVYIYAESLERTYFDKKLFPNLITYLKKLQNKSVDFSDVRQVVNTGFTIAGTVATQCGIPLFIPSKNILAGNSMEGIDKFLPKAICLGDILKSLNYYVVEMQGSSINFSGIGKFYKTHKFDEVYGREELMPYLKDKNYINGWGLYDDTLFDLAYKKFLTLSKEHKNFALFLATMDTHHPNGQLSKSCRNNLYGNGKNSILNCVKCSDYLIYKFIEKIRHSKYGKNTLIVITSDHLAMRNTAFDILKKGKRRNLFLILDPKNEKYVLIDKPSSMIDVGATVLEKLGIDMDIGLGRNLLKRNSLMQEIKNFDDKLLSWKDAILELWSFPKLEKKYRVDIDKKIIKIGKNRYKIPLLLKVDNNLKIQPIFEFNSPIKLFEIVKEFNATQKFIWVDRCERINIIFDKNFQREYCLVQGSLGSKLEIKALKEKKNDINADLLFEKQIIDNQKYKKYIFTLNNFAKFSELNKKGIYKGDLINTYDSTLEKGIDFKKEFFPNFVKEIKGLSGKEKWGRWSDANLNRNVEFVFKKPLPKDFILELKVGAYGPNINQITKVIVGDKEKDLNITSRSFKIYKLKFEDVKSNKIVFIPPYPQAPGADTRKLGIGFVYLKIKSLKN